MTTLEKLVVLLDIQVIRSWQVRATGQFERKLGVVEDGQNVWDNGLLVDVHTENLTLLVDPNDTVSGFMLRSDEDGLSGYAVHVYTRPGFQVIQMDETVFRDEVNDAVLFRDLHCDWEVVRGLGREVHIDGFLDEGGIRSRVVNFNDVELYRAR